MKDDNKSDNSIKYKKINIDISSKQLLALSEKVLHDSKWARLMNDYKLLKI